MSIFKYKAIDQSGVERSGTVDAVTIDVAISSLQRRGLVISSIKPAEGTSMLEKNISFFDRVSNKDIVILSRQMSTLFEAQVSALRTFRLLAAEAPSRTLQQILNEIADDLQGGSTISNALAKHPKAFSDFYVNMVRSGEEAGKLDQILLYLADYLDRQFEVTSKAKNALIYPIFVVFTFVVVMILMLTMVIPNISKILEESGQAIPIYTRIVLSISHLFVNYGLILAILLAVAAFFIYRYNRTTSGHMAIDRFKLSVPYVGTLYKKLYLARIADNMNTMLLSAIPMIKALEITASIVGSAVYEDILKHAVEGVKGGTTLSESLSKYPEIPGIMVQMAKVGEETGELGDILKSLAKFYNREVINAVDTLVGLIEPVMIVFLGVSVAVLLASVLIPIYNVAANT